MKKLLILLIFLLSSNCFAQEINCKVQVQHAKITGVDPQVFTAMERAVSEFINNRKWTIDDYQTTEKIQCNILINLTNKTSNDDIYEATISIQSTRPVFNSNYDSPTMNAVDKDVTFKYNQFSPLNFDDNRVTGADALESNFTAIIAYYAYLVIGLDYDSYSQEGGGVYFKKAQNIVNNAPEESNIKGWKAFEDKRNRYWIVDQLLSPRFNNLRKYWYSMHRLGLDIMYNKPDEGRQKILSGIGMLANLYRENPGSSLVQFFFNAKSDELIRVVTQLPKAQRAPYLIQLAQADLVNVNKYNSLK